MDQGVGRFAFANDEPSRPAAAPDGVAAVAADPPPPGWHKAKPLVLRRGASAEGALAAIVRSGLAHLRANEACVLARAHDEGVHQMRVALRRLRSGLGLFAPMLPADQVAYLTGELKWLIGSLGPARDLDVFLAETLPVVAAQFDTEPRLDELRIRAEATRDEAYRVAGAAILSPRYTGLIMLLGAWADGRRWRDGTGGGPAAALDASAVAVATSVLDAHYAAIVTVHDRFAGLNAKERHKLRIEIKKLRYACEFFFSLFPRRRQAAFLSSLKALQDQLGVSNDIAVARRLLLGVVRGTRGRARGRIGFAAGLVVGWHGHIADGREDALRASWARLMERPVFWPRTETAGGELEAGAAEAGAASTEHSSSLLYSQA